MDLCLQCNNQHAQPPLRVLHPKAICVSIVTINVTRRRRLCALCNNIGYCNVYVRTEMIKRTLAQRVNEDSAEIPPALYTFDRICKYFNLYMAIMLTCKYFKRHGNYSVARGNTTWECIVLK